MSSIDSRVVEAKFNNAQFGQGVSDTIGHLDKLKAGLKLDGAAAGIEGVNAAARSFDPSSMESGAGRISGAFSAMQVTAITALSTIVNKAVNAGLSLAKSLTISPISDGLADYHAKLTSVQTIMNATGADLNTVNGYFGQLDTYADKTVYNLSDMTGAFAKFTNAGVGMDKSVPAIKGIANMVALAGQGADAAGIAMYNLSQSIAGGFLTTTDYKSLNLANVATKDWKQQMIDGAVAAGKLKKSGGDAYSIVGGKAGNAYTSSSLFNDALSEGWASSDVLLGVLGKYGDATTDVGKKAQAAAQDVKSFPMMMDTLKASVGTGWTDTFEILLGNVDESKQLFTSLTNTIGGFLGRMGDARNTMLQDWKDAGGRTALLDGLKTTFQILGSVMQAVGTAFRNIFPAKSGQQLADTSKAFANFMKDLVPSEETIIKIVRSFEGLFAILHIGWTIIKGIAKFFFDMFAGIEEGNKGILDTTATIGDFLVGLDQAITAGGGVTKFFTTLKDLLFVIINPLKNIGEMIGTAFAGLDLSSFGAGLGNFISSLLSFGSAADDTSKKASSAADTIKAVFGGLISIAEKVAETVGKFARSIAGAFEGISFDKLMTGLQTGGLVAMVGTLTHLAGAIKGFSVFGGKGGPGGIFTSMKAGLDQLNGTLKSMQNDNNASALLKLAGAIALLALAVMLLASIDPGALIAASVALAVLFVELTKGMQAFNAAVGIMGAAKLNLLVPALIGIAIAVLLLVVAVKILTALSWEGLAKGLLGLGVMLGMLSASVRIMAENNKRMLSTGLGLLAIAIAVDLLVIAVKYFAEMDYAAMAKGLAGVGAILLELALFTRFAKAGAGAVAQGFAIAMLAGAILVLAKAVQEMAKLSWSDMIRGIGGLALGMLMIAGALKLIPPSAILQALAISKVTGALSAFMDVFMEMAALSWNEVIRGMMAFVVSFGMVILAIKAVEKVNFGQLAGLSLVTSALEQMANALVTLGSMSWEEMIHGLVGLVGTIAVLVIALKALEKVPANAGLALGIVAGSLALLAPALATMGGIPIVGIVGALVLLAGVFAIIGVSANLLAGSVPVLMGLGIAIGLLGVAVALAGAGVLLFAMGFTMLGAAAAVGTAGIVAAFSAIIGLIPMVLEQVGLGLVALAGVIATSAPAFIGAFTAILTALLTSIINVLPKVAVLIMELITLILVILVDAVPKMIEAGITILLAFLTGIADNIGKVIDIGMRIITEFLAGIARNIGGVVNQAVNIIVNFINGISRNLPKIIQSGIDLILAFMNGIGDAARNNGAAIADAAWNMATGIVDGVVSGLKKLGGKFKDALLQLAKDAFSGVLSFFGIHSPSRLMGWVGEMAVQGLANGLDDYSHVAAKSAVGVGESVLDAMGKTISGLGDLIGNGMDDLSPVITPVLDLSSIQRDSAQIGQMLQTAPISLSDTMSKTADASAGYNANQAALAELVAQASNNVSFTQVNNSPKALSSVEIYRQTNNQLSQVKGALTNAN